MGWSILNDGFEPGTKVRIIKGQRKGLTGVVESVPRYAKGLYGDSKNPGGPGILMALTAEVMVRRSGLAGAWELMAHLRPLSAVERLGGLV